MPTVNRPAMLAAFYSATRQKIDDIPTLLLPADTTLFRSFNPKSAYTLLPKPPAGKHVSKMQANGFSFRDGVWNLTTDSAVRHTIRESLRQRGYIACCNSRHW